MRVTGVTSRFLALLDVTLILLGILMISLAETQEAAQAEAREQVAASAAAGAGGPASAGTGNDDLAAENVADFVFVFAGTAGSERGRCYLMDGNRRRVQEVRTDSDGDIRRILEARAAGSREPVVMLMISNEGFDWMWSPERVQALAQTWGVSVVPVYRWD